VLAALNAGEKLKYDVSAEQAKEATVQLALPLSALAPRLLLLQDELLPPAVTVRVGVDPERLIREWGPAAGGPDAVRVRRDAAGLLRRFLPPEDGGIDKEQRRDKFLRDLVPLHLLAPEIQELEGDPRTAVWGRFMIMFVAFQMEPRLPRDMVLRGRLKEASEALTRALDEIRYHRDRLQTTPDVRKNFAKWKEELFQAFGALEKARQAARKGGPQEAVDVAQAQIDSVWKAGQANVLILADGSAAYPRGGQATYLQALCMHEQAARAQHRADQAARRGAGADEVVPLREAAKAGWAEANDWWESYLLEYPPTEYTANARVLHAAAREAVGQRDRARAILEDTAGPADDHDRLARAYLAGRLKPR
jgi:hypothetical protein